MIRPHRESKYVRFARLAYALAQANVPHYTQLKGPQRFTQPQIMVCLLLTQYLNLSYREVEEWLLASTEVRDVLELTEVPDHTTISRVLKRWPQPRFKALLGQVLAQMKQQENVEALEVNEFRFTPTRPYKRRPYYD